MMMPTTTTVASGRCTSAPAPDDNAFRFLAHAYNKMGYYEDALRVWDAFLKVRPNVGQAKANRAKVAASLAKG